MCEDGTPAGVSDALVMLDRALGVLAAADATGLPGGEQAGAVLALERAESRLTAARARVLSAFMAQGGCQDDGHGNARTWLRWRARITRGAAAGAVGWARRLAGHPVIAQALAAGDLSASWAREICVWTGRLPEGGRADADAILVQAAAGGAELADLAGLAEEMYQRTAGPDAEGQDGFDDRCFSLGLTFRGVGRAEGDLTAGCTAALGAVLEGLGRKAGPEDIRTARQRRHDALEEACRRLIAAGMVPGRAGQPTHIQLHLTLDQLRGQPGTSDAERAWATARAAQPGWLTGPDAEAAVCDATLIPIVTGHPDPAALSRLTETFLEFTHPASSHPTHGQDGASHPPPGQDPDDPMAPGQGPDARPAAGQHPHHHPPGQDPDNQTAAGHPPPSQDPPGQAAGLQHGPQPGAPCGCTCGGCTCQPAGKPLPAVTRQRLQRALLHLAADALSGPAGLAALLRTSLTEPALTAASFPLDIGTATDIIPAHLRRAATTRHPPCAFPGCGQPASTCQIHHLIPRAAGGPTTLNNLVPLCPFHHLTAIHRWGWTLTLNPDTTTTATSPDRSRTLHSHSPPAQAA